MIRTLVPVIAIALGLSACAIEPVSDFEGADTQLNPTVDAKRDHDYVGNYNFKVEINGVTQAAFKEVSGLDSGIDVVFYGGVDLLPEFVDWVEDGKAGRAGPRDIVLIVTDSEGRTQRHTLIGATPAPSANSKGNSAMTEEIEMVIERLERG